MSERFKSKRDTDKNLYFDVPGAGLIEISKDPHYLTGEAVGFGFGVSWGEHEYAGGVLGRDEAKKLAEFILDTIEKVEETMEDEYKRRTPRKYWDFSEK